MGLFFILLHFIRDIKADPHPVPPAARYYPVGLLQRAIIITGKVVHILIGKQRKNTGFTGRVFKPEFTGLEIYFKC